MLVRRTSETESGFLPTPVKYDSHGTWESNNYHGLGWSAKNDPDRLDEKSRGARMWPTPVKNEDRAAAYTPETSYRHFSEGSHQVHLAQAVRDARMWPTITMGTPLSSSKVRSAEFADGRLPTPVEIAKGITKFPTPTAQDADKKRSKAPPPRVRLTSTGLPEADRPSGSGAQLNLMQAAVIADGGRRMYPTPIRSDGSVSKNPVTLQKVENGEAFNQLAREIRKEEMQAAGEWQSNPLAVRGEGEATVGSRARNRLPTPTHKNGLRNGNEPGSSGGEHYPNAWQSPGHPEYGELNPGWVEWIMGWCIGWTSLEPLDPAAFETWWILMQPNPLTGYPHWWEADPSEFPGAHCIPKTVKPKDKEDDERRIARIAALGNGQVSAVVCGATVLLAVTDQPEGD